MILYSFLFVIVLFCYFYLVLVPFFLSVADSTLTSEGSEDVPRLVLLRITIEPLLVLSS